MTAHTFSCPGSRGSGCHARAASPRRKLLPRGRFHPSATGHRQTHRQTHSDGGDGDPGPWRRREGAGAPMGATEAGGTKSRRLLSVLRRWRSSPRLRRMRSALRAERGECARGRHPDGHWECGAAAVLGHPAEEKDRGPQTQAGQGRVPVRSPPPPPPLRPVCRLGSALGEILGDSRQNLMQVGSPPRPHTWPRPSSAVPLRRCYDPPGSLPLLPICTQPNPLSNL